MTIIEIVITKMIIIVKIKIRVIVIKKICGTCVSRDYS